jgi:hypothetical protein
MSLSANTIYTNKSVTGLDGNLLLSDSTGSKEDAINQLTLTLINGNCQKFNIKLNFYNATCFLNFVPPYHAHNMTEKCGL